MPHLDPTKLAQIWLWPGLGPSSFALQLHEPLHCSCRLLCCWALPGCQMSLILGWFRNRFCLFLLVFTLKWYYTNTLHNSITCLRYICRCPPLQVLGRRLGDAGCTLAGTGSARDGINGYNTVHADATWSTPFLPAPGCREAFLCQPRHCGLVCSRGAAIC